MPQAATPPPGPDPDTRDPAGIDRVHAWFLCPRRYPEPLDGACTCAARYAALSLRERQWLHTGVSDWSCCDD